MREAIAAKAMLLLKKHGFFVSEFLQYNSCFDIAAKKHDKIFLIKVFGNIDALREEQALELKKIAAAFTATALVLGEKTKAFALKEKIAYERYGLPVLAIDSFAELLNDNLPSIRFFKGKETVALDAEKLKQKRKQLGLTLSELADRIDLSAQAVYRFEKNATATLSAAKRLEDVLQEKLTKQINILEPQNSGQQVFDEKSFDESFEKIRSLGLQLALFEHAPFRAYSRPEDALLIDKGYSKQDLKRKALVLEKAKTLVKGGHSVIISREQKYSIIHDTPIIQEEELDSFTKARDLLETIKEREKKKRKQ